MTHENDNCGSCMVRRRNGFAMLGLDDVTLRNFVNLTEQDVETVSRYAGLRPASIEELREISIEQCWVGRAVFNELVSHIRDSEPNLAEHAEYVTRAIEAGALVLGIAQMIVHLGFEACFDDLLEHVLHQAAMGKQLLRVFSIRQVLFYGVPRTFANSSSVRSVGTAIGVMVRLLSRPVMALTFDTNHFTISLRAHLSRVRSGARRSSRQ